MHLVSSAPVRARPPFGDKRVSYAIGREGVVCVEAATGADASQRHVVERDRPKMGPARRENTNAPSASASAPFESITRWCATGNSLDPGCSFSNQSVSHLVQPGA